MLNAKAFAHSVTIVTAIVYVLCLVISYIAPDFVYGIANSWVHSLSLDTLQTSSVISIGSALWGLVTIGAMAWITTYSTIVLYNRFLKK